MDLMLVGISMELLAATLALELTKGLNAVELLVEEISTLDDSVRLLEDLLGDS